MKRHLFILLTISMLLALSACADSDTEAEASSGVLTVYTYDSFGGQIIETMTALFSERFGTTIVFEQPGDTGELFSRLYFERENPRADAFVGLDQTYLGRIASDDLSIPYRPSGFVPAIPELEPAGGTSTGAGTGTGTVNTSADGTSAAGTVNTSADNTSAAAMLAVPFDYGFITLNYDSQALGFVPRTWDDLLDPRLERSIIMLNPATSSPGRNFLLLTVAELGEDRFAEFWRALKPNILTVSAGWSDGYGLYGQGEAPIVVSYDTSPAYHRIYEETDRYRSLPIDESAYLQIELAGVVRGTPHEELARAFIDLLVSPEIQALVPLNQFMYPAQAGVPLPEGFARSDERVSRPILIGPNAVSAGFERWLGEWEEVMR